MQQSKKKILFLGGSYFQVPAIEYARAHGYHAISTGYLADSPGHRVADEFHLVSTTDREGILALAKTLGIDAITAYASDPAALTAAYVCDKLGLAGSPYAAVQTLSDKSRFRKFLSEHNHRCPWYITGSEPDEILAKYPGGKAVLKPVDASGSKGVSIIADHLDIRDRFDHAMQSSRSNRVILEQYIESEGPHIHGDGFVHNGEVIFLCMGDHCYSPLNPVSPVATIVPSQVHRDLMPELHGLVQTIIRELGFVTGGINVETIRDKQDNLYVMEIGARSGGNFIPQLMQLATGYDLVAANIEALLGGPVPKEYGLPEGTYFAEVGLEARQSGKFDRVNLPGYLNQQVRAQYLLLPQNAVNPVALKAGETAAILLMDLGGDAEVEILKEHIAHWEWILVK